MPRFVRLTRGAPGQLNANGLEVLRLALWENGKEVDHVRAISGAAGRQNFRTLANEVRQAFEPIPEGRYHQIGNPEWAGTKNDYSTNWSPALGPVVIEIYGERAIMAHLDGGGPGSAGCVCPFTRAELKKMVSWWDAGRPDWFEVDWGLGTVPKPQAQPEQLKRCKIYYNDGKATAFLEGKPVSAIPAILNFDHGRLSVAIGGRQLTQAQLASVSLEIAYRKDPKK